MGCLWLRRADHCLFGAGLLGAGTLVAALAAAAAFAFALAIAAGEFTSACLVEPSVSPTTASPITVTTAATATATFVRAALFRFV